MKEFGYKTPDANLSDSGLNSFDTAYWNLSPEELVQHAQDKNMGTLSDKGALVIKTGKFTGRSPKDRPLNCSGSFVFVFGTPQQQSPN